MCQPAERETVSPFTRGEISLDEEVIISITLLRSVCGCKSRNCFAIYHTSILEPVSEIIQVREKRLQQGFTHGNKGEGP